MPALERALGRWNLTAFGINIVIGSAVFLTPALVAAQLSYWAPLAILVAGLAVLCIALAIGFYAPAMNAGAPRVALILCLFLSLAWINALGIRQSALMINTFALAKLAPLAVFIVIGLFFVRWEHLQIGRA